MSIHLHPVSLWQHWEIAMAKPDAADDFHFTDPVAGGHYVQLGPGHKRIVPRDAEPLESEYTWQNLDYPEWDADNDPLPYDDRFINGICCYHSMDHFAKPIQVLAEIQRVLIPGGWFVNVVPHYASELWHSDLTHKSQFATETWRSIFSTRHYDHAAVSGNAAEWQLDVTFNMIMGLTERNTVLVTQMIKRQT
jgi:SAM-dependent methyltransferase